MSRYAMCPYCGHRLSRVYDSWGEWDGETYECEYCSEFGDSSEGYDDELDVYDAALIWASNGKDEDYMFGYTEEELEDAL